MQSYSTIIGVIELRQGGVGYRTSKKRYNIGNSTVTLIMNRFQELGIPLDELKAMSPRKVEEAFYPPENLRRAKKEIPDFFKIHKAMLAMDTPDLAFQWMEYKKENPNGYQLSQFYKLYGEFLKDNFGQTSVSMPVERIPGERMYIDWVGDQPELLTDPATGEIRKILCLLRPSALAVMCMQSSLRMRSYPVSSAASSMPWNTMGLFRSILSQIT